MMKNPSLPIRTLLTQLQAASGLQLTEAAVERAVAQRMRLLQQRITRAAYLAQAVLRQEETAALLELLVVPETWFFRDPAVFSALAAFTRERLAQAGLPCAPVRILSLPCSTGEEPYTVAMSLLEAGIAASDFAIDAVDLSHRAIERARHAVYQQNSFRTAPLDFRDRWFQPCAEGHALRPNVRNLVRFTQGNLFDAAPQAAYDVILCRNLLIYFDEETQQRATGKLASLLKDDGMLITGYAELAVCGKRLFAMQTHAGAFVLRKRRADMQDVAVLQMPRRRRQHLLPPAPVRLPPFSISPPRRGTQPPRPHDFGRAPEELQTMLLQARRLADSGDLTGAARCVNACLQAFPESAEAHFLSALIGERLPHGKNIEDSLRRTIYFDPQHYEALCRLALLAESAGDAGRAVSLKQRAARVFARRGTESADR
jgi:chemotaxis protein methyltransferase WspC